MHQKSSKDHKSLPFLIPKQILAKTTHKKTLQKADCKINVNRNKNVDLTHILLLPKILNSRGLWTFSA
jgi:hypothetical protein